MTARPKPVDLGEFEDAKLPANWCTLVPDSVEGYSVNVTDLIADLKATRDERDELMTALRELVKRIDSITTEEFRTGGDKVERERARSLLKELEVPE